MIALGGVLLQEPSPILQAILDFLMSEFPTVLLVILVIAGVIYVVYKGYKIVSADMATRRKEDREFLDALTKRFTDEIEKIETKRSAHEADSVDRLNNAMSVINGHDLQGKQILELVKHTDTVVTDIKPRVEAIEKKMTTRTTKGPSR